MNKFLQAQTITVIEPLYGEITEPSGLPEFREYLEAEGKSPHTVAAYLSDLRHYAHWLQTTVGMPFYPSTIASYDLKAYRQHCRQSARMAASTLNRRLASLRTFCEWAIQAGHLNIPLAELFRGVIMVRKVAPPPQWLGEQEYHRFMRQVEIGVNTGRQIGSKAKTTTEFGKKMALRDRAIIALMSLAGLRVGEVAHLQIRDLEIHARSGSVTIYSGKGDKDREIQMHRELRSALTDWLAVRSAENAAEPLFIGRRKGQALGVNGIQERVSAFAEAAGLAERNITPHTLRHTFARRFVIHNRQRLGDDCLMMLKDIMGHARIETTMQYARPGRSETAAALENL